MGYLRRLTRDPQPALDELRARYGPVVGLGGGPVRLAVVGDPAALRDLLFAPVTSFRWGHRFNVIGAVVGKESMIVSDGADHRRRRGAVQAGFGRRRLNTWIPMIVDHADAAVADLGLVDGGSAREIDLAPVGRAVVLGVVTRALFGERLAGRAAEIGELFERPQAYLEAPALRQIPHPFPFGARARMKADRRRLDAIVDAEIAHRRAHPDGEAHDVLETLVDDGVVTDGENRDQVVTLLGAGYDTTAASLAWMLWRTALTPGLWERLGREADEVYGLVPTADLDDSTLRRLDLAGRVMRETTRLHPAGAISPRQAVVDVTVGDVVIPKGTLILWSAHLAGRDPDAWQDPLRFDPDRYVDMSPERAALADAAWVPFGRGTRNCIGFMLAQIELTLIVARLAQRIHIEPVAETVPRPVGMVVNRPTGGAPMHVTRRHPAAAGP
ncbi:MAG: cytochrome P450 [Ilumatobacteraceae bacterium]